MAGRGRGRGRGGRGMSFSVESLGFGRGESLPGPILQPPSTFPPLEFKPVPLAAGEDYDYLLALKQEFRAAMKESPYYIKTPERKKDIQRYSDKYQMNGQDGDNSWEPDWSRLPTELRPKIKKKRKLKPTKPNLSLAAKKIKADDILEALEKQEKGEEAEDEKEEGEEKEDEDEENIEEEFHDDEDLEDDNDYNLNYFDNGEGYGADEDDDLDEGPVY